MEPDKKVNPKIEKIRRELHRRSLDQIVVNNPTDNDVTVIWDKFRHVVPANSTRTLPRYIAMKYIRETTDRMIYMEEEEHVKSQNEKRANNGHPPLTPQEREQQALQYGIHLGNEKKREELFEQLYGGISEEYGVDMPDSEPQIEKRDKRTFEEKMMEKHEREAPQPQEIPQITEQVTEKAKEDLRKKVGKNGKEN